MLEVRWGRLHCCLEVVLRNNLSIVDGVPALWLEILLRDNLPIMDGVFALRLEDSGHFGSRRQHWLGDQGRWHERSMHRYP